MKTLQAEQSARKNKSEWIARTAWVRCLIVGRFDADAKLDNGLIPKAAWQTPPAIVIPDEKHIRLPARSIRYWICPQR
jgi:hypothetical protein